MSVKVLRGTPLKTSEVWNGKHFSYSQRQLGQAYDTRGTIITYDALRTSTKTLLQNLSFSPFLSSSTLLRSLSPNPSGHTQLFLCF